MPEGDTIAAAAKRLRTWLLDQPLVAVGGYRLAGHQEHLVGAKVTEVQTHGKLTRIAFSTRVYLVVHLGMNGRWFALERSRPIEEGRHAGVLHTQAVQVICTSPQRFELQVGRLPPQVLAQEAGLGPDLVQGDVDHQLVAEAWHRESRPILDVLLDQRLAAGIGNIYKSEVLFDAKVAPLTLACALNLDALVAMAKQANRWLRRNHLDDVRRTRWGLPGPRLWVYERGGQPCLVCGARIVRAMQGTPARSTYFCPVCQAASVQSPR